jgi:hypothetical protein
VKTITNLRRLEDTVTRLGGEGDDWHITWADDDRQYVSMNDGTGLPGTPANNYNSRAYAVCGMPPDVTFEYLPGYPDLLNDWGTPQSSRYYNFGIVAVNGTIYQYLNTPNHPFHEPGPRFVGAKLIYSPDNGRTWHNQDRSTPVRWEPWQQRNRTNMVFFCEPGDAFSLVSVLQMGRGYRDNSDGFVYVYAPSGNTEGSMNQLVLGRVPTDRILDRSAYEFFVGRHHDGNAAWSSRIERRGVVHTFPSGWVNTLVHPWAWHPSVVYIAPLGVYLMANWGTGCTPEGEWFGKPSYLGFWTAPDPWGPWIQVHEEEAWTPAGDANARAYEPQIAPKWIAPDGSSFWVIWSDFQETDGKRPFYAFNIQKIEITIAD